MYSQLIESLREHQARRDELKRSGGLEPLSSDPLDLDQLPISPTGGADREGASSQGQRTSMLAA